MKNKPKILIAKNAGFCFGVRRAVEMVNDALNKNGDKKVYCWGQLIHNPWVVEDLKKKGLQTIQKPKEIEENEFKFVIRSHGIPQDKLKQILDKKAEIIDTTCPFVKKAREAAEKFYQEGFQTVIFGDAEHVEVQGINSVIDYSGIISSGDLSKEDIAKIKNNKVAVLSQTTQKKEKFDEFVSKLKSICEEELKVKNTICMETSLKQKEIAELAGKKDLLLVIGGKNSSNTSKLAEIGKKSGADTYHIEHHSEFSKNWIKKTTDKVIIAAGASTPDKLINDLHKAITASLE